jgi:hypothetical protein
VKIKVCPYCASDDLRYYTEKKNILEHGYWCGNCGAISPTGVNKEDAKKMHNLRRPTDELVEALGELIDIVDGDLKDIDSFTTQPARLALAKAKGE